MAKVALTLDKRSVKSDGTSPVKIAVTFGKNKRVLVSTGISVRKEDWNESLSKIVSGPLKVRYNNALDIMLSSLKVKLLEMYSDGSMSDADYKKVKEAAEEVLRPGTYQKREIMALQDEVSDYMRNMSPGTKRVYQSTVNKLRTYSEVLGSEIDVNKMNLRWIEDFESWMKGCNLCTNTRNIHHGNIKAVLNNSVRNDRLMRNPYMKFKFVDEETEKRVLTIEQVRQLMDAPCEQWQEPFKDMFFLVMYLIGINIVDLFSLTRDNIVNGRLNYKRAKTHKLYSIKIEPEAQEILDKYPGDKKLISVCERWTDHKDMTKHMNHALKLIGTGSKKGYGGNGTALFPFISVYYARFSWATIAKNDCGASMDEIADALGHQSGLRVTNVYVRRDTETNDRLNRKVIDKIKGR